MLIVQIVEQRLIKIIEKLAKNGLVEYNEKIKSTNLGETMSRNYVDLETMLLICKNPNKYSIKDIMEILSQSKENERFRSRNEERKQLTQINNDTNIRYHINGSINTYDKKCFILYQAAMSCIV